MPAGFFCSQHFQSSNSLEIKLYMSIHRSLLKSNALNWLQTLKIHTNEPQYKFSAATDSTIFCTCFALFILDLFGETKKFTSQEKQNWISYIKGFQNKKHGYFEPKNYYHQDKERIKHQLTCFCLSALGILYAEPEVPLNFIDDWGTPDNVEKYLYEQDCHKGKPGSGNKAMFLAIFLTYEYERTGEGHLLDNINAWFKFHNETQNRNGFWGHDLKSHYLHGLQNGFHQFVIYYYWKKEIPKLNRIIDIALMSQDRHGFFAPTPGGEGCHDYDSIHTLAIARRATDYRKNEIEACLSKAFNAILSTRNNDGGFCQSNCSLNSMKDFLRYIPTYFSNRSLYLWYYRARVSLGVVVKQSNPIYTGWTEKPRYWDESNLWDTWFRCLALSEIVHTNDNTMLEDLRNVHFHKVLGLGYFLK